MELSVAKLSMVFFIASLLLTNVTTNPIGGSHWYPSDPRCSGGVSSSYRLKRGVTTNNSGSGFGNYWKYNSNLGSCVKVYGKAAEDRSAFQSQAECDSACRNIYHF